MNFRLIPHPGQLVILLGSLLLQPTTLPGSNTQSMAGRSTVYAPHGIVATSHPLASSAGLRMLQNGGNAFDAAVAAAAVLSVTEPMMTGVGGDVFALAWLADEARLVALNSSGRSGSGMTLDEMIKRGRKEVPSSGPESITVPGAFAGWTMLLESHGKLSLQEVLAPAIEIARDGFPVSPNVADFWAERVDFLKEDEAAQKTFLLNGERPPKAGDWFSNPDYAVTLELLAARGTEVLYGGELGSRIAHHVQSLGGFLKPEDFQNHTSDWVTPIWIDYKGYRVWELPPNGQGIAALEILKILEPFDLASLGHNSPAYLHQLIEAKKLAYADLEYFVGDPSHMKVSPEDLLSPEFVQSRRNLISTRALSHASPGKALTESETTYLSVSDSDGNMVSFINSVAATFGSGVVVPATGFVLQNRGSGFTMKEGMANTVAPRKRPFHTIIPAFVTRPDHEGKQQPWLSFGVMGGAMQPQGHVQVFLNLIEFGMDLQQALDATRFRHMEGLRVALEPAISLATVEALKARGHDVIDPKGIFFGGGQAVMRLEKGWAGASDPRMDGTASGY